MRAPRLPSFYWRELRSAVAALGGDEHLRSIMFVTFTLYRAPLTLIYNLQGRVLSLLVRLESGVEIRRWIDQGCRRRERA